MAEFSDGDKVCWAWGANQAFGVIERRYTRRITRVLKGSKVTRNASKDEPAYLIRQTDGDLVLKSGSEIEKR